MNNPSLTEIKSALTQLSPDEITELSDWLDDYQQSQWDKQIENDLQSGKLDRLIQQAEKSYQEGKCKPM